MSLLVSVLISTHNPNIGRLERTIRAIGAQTLDAKHWELVLVDNASVTPVNIDTMLQQGAESRTIRETRLGKTYGLLTGIQHSKAALLVVVDDDNVLDPDYLENAVRIFDNADNLGVAGGIVEPEWCDEEPENWVSEFFYVLALRNYGNSAMVATRVSHPDTYPMFAPIGAGMVARRAALTNWMSQGKHLTGPRGGDLTRGEDNDMALTALHSGWSIGYFPRLKLTHLIPGNRLRIDYLARLNRGIAKSWVHVVHRHSLHPPTAVPPWTVPLRKARAYMRSRAWAGPKEYLRWQAACGHFEGRADLYRLHTASK